MFFSERSYASEIVDVVLEAMTSLKGEMEKLKIILIIK